MYIDGVTNNIYNNDMKKEVTQAIESFHIPSWQEIPEIGLYLDQVSKYINTFLVQFPEMNVTPSMISNYAKQKLISRVNKKTYTRQQIATLILIVLFKNVTSIDHIRTYLQQMEKQNVETEKMYEQFRAILLSTTSKQKNLFHPEDELLTAIAVALSRKMYVEKVFESMKD